MPEQLLQLRPYAGVAIAAILIAWQFWPTIGPLLAKAWRTLSASTQQPPAAGPLAANAVDADTLDFHAVKRLQERFARMKCPEGLKAVDVCLAHFWPHPTEPPNSEA